MCKELASQLLELADRSPDDPVINRGVRASVSTLNVGVIQITSVVNDPMTKRKHHARLMAALRTMAAALDA